MLQNCAPLEIAGLLQRGGAHSQGGRQAGGGLDGGRAEDAWAPATDRWGPCTSAGPVLRVPPGPLKERSLTLGWLPKLINFGKHTERAHLPSQSNTLSSASTPQRFSCRQLNAGDPAGGPNQNSSVTYICWITKFANLRILFVFLNSNYRGNYKNNINIYLKFIKHQPVT